jgi:hypothetical protein
LSYTINGHNFFAFSFNASLFCFAADCARGKRTPHAEVSGFAVCLIIFCIVTAVGNYAAGSHVSFTADAAGSWICAIIWPTMRGHSITVRAESSLRRTFFVLLAATIYFRCTKRIAVFRPCFVNGVALAATGIIASSAVFIYSDTNSLPGADFVIAARSRNTYSRAARLKCFPAGVGASGDTLFIAFFFTFRTDWIASSV